VDTHRFDNLSRTAARHANRRSALAGALGIGATVLSRFTPAARAQQATPVADGTPSATDTVTVLYVQSFSTGTFVPRADGDGYTLTLEDGTGQVVYFSDRPDRVVGTLTDAQFVDGRAFDPSDPPNAAIVTKLDAGEDILVVELTDPAHDEASGSVSYTVRVLDGQPESAALASLAARQEDATLDESLGPITLFIDQLACTPDDTRCTHNSDCCSNFCCNAYDGCRLAHCLTVTT
jgi:hypothetical protein